MGCLLTFKWVDCCNTLESFLTHESKLPGRLLAYTHASAWRKRAQHGMRRAWGAASLLPDMCLCVQAVLGVFQKLVASKAHDHEGFRLLGAVTTHVPLPALSPFLPTVRALC